MKNVKDVISEILANQKIRDCFKDTYRSWQGVFLTQKGLVLTDYVYFFYIDRSYSSEKPVFYGFRGDVCSRDDVCVECMEEEKYNVRYVLANPVKFIKEFEMKGVSSVLFRNKERRLTIAGIELRFLTGRDLREENLMPYEEKHRIMFQYPFRLGEGDGWIDAWISLKHLSLMVELMREDELVFHYSPIRTSEWRYPAVFHAGSKSLYLKVEENE